MFHHQQPQPGFYQSSENVNTYPQPVHQFLDTGQPHFEDSETISPPQSYPGQLTQTFYQSYGPTPVPNQSFYPTDNQQLNFPPNDFAATYPQQRSPVLEVPPFQERGFAGDGVDETSLNFLRSDGSSIAFDMQQWIGETGEGPPVDILDECWFRPLVEDQGQRSAEPYQSMSQNFSPQSSPQALPELQTTTLVHNRPMYTQSQAIPQQTPQFQQTPQPHQARHQTQQQPQQQSYQSPQQQYPQQPPQQSYPSTEDTSRREFHLDRENAHLGFVTNYTNLLTLYRNYQFIYYPLHPAILDESNLRYFFETNERTEDISPLSISLNLGATLGAWLTGNKALAVEYESRAIGQMSYLSQFPQAMTDYSLAMAAYVLGMYSLYFQLNAEKSREYLQMAMDICKKINALNSDVYSRCLYAMSTHTSASYQNITLLKNELESASKLEYYSILSTTSPLPFNSAMYSRFNQSGNNCCPLSPSAMFACCELIRTAANVVGGIRLYQQHFSKPGAREGDQVKEHMHRMLQRLLEAINVYETSAASHIANMLKEDENLPQSIPCYTALLISASRTQCYHIAGDDQTASQFASQIISKLEGLMLEGNSLHLSGGVMKFLEPIFAFFLETGDLSKLETLLSLFTKHPDATPIIETLRATYKNKLEGALSVQRRQQQLQQQHQHQQQQQQLQLPQHPQHQQLQYHASSQQQQPQQPYYPAGALSTTSAAGGYGQLTPHYNQQYANTAQPMPSTHTPQQQPPAPQVISYNYNYNNYNYRINIPGPANVAFMPGGDFPQDFNPMGGPMNARGGEIITRGAMRKRPLPPQRVPDPRFGAAAMAMTRKRRKANDPMPPKLKQQEEIHPSILNEGSHLTLVADCLKYLSDFRRYLWHFFPLHPSVLDESNVKYFLSHEGSNEISSLSLGYNVCMCRGAMISGHKEISIEFFNRAEQHLAYLVESPNSMKDYSIALAVGVLIWQASYLQVKTEKIHYYLNVALDICKAIKAFNSDVFIRCNYILATLPHGIDQIEKMQESLDKVARYPYHPITATTAESFTFYENPAKTTIKGGTKTFRCPSQLQQRMPVSLRNLTNVTAVCGIMANVMSGLNLPVEEMRPEVLDKVLICVDSLENLIKEIKDQQKKSEDYWPNSINKHNRFFILATRAQCYQRKGNKEMALMHARGFVELMEKKKFKHVWTSVSASTTMVMKVLFEYGEDELLSRQIASTEKWIRTLPVMEKIKRDFEQKLVEKSASRFQEISEEDDISSPATVASTATPSEISNGLQGN